MSRIVFLLEDKGMRSSVAKGRITGVHRVRPRAVDI